jgi:hypothetical protein
MFTHILLPTNGSPLSEAAIHQGIQFAGSINARVTGFHAIQPPGEAPSTPRRAPSHTRERLTYEGSFTEESIFQESLMRFCLSCHGQYEISKADTDFTGQERTLHYDTPESHPRLLRDCYSTPCMAQ